MLLSDIMDMCIIGASLSEPHLVSTAAAQSVYSDMYIHVYIVRPPHVITD